MKERYEVSIKFRKESAGFAEYYKEKQKALSQGDFYFRYLPRYAEIKVTDLEKGKVLAEYGTEK